MSLPTSCKSEYILVLNVEGIAVQNLYFNNSLLSLTILQAGQTRQFYPRHTS